MDLETQLLASRILHNWEFIKIQYADDVFLSLKKSTFSLQQIMDLMEKISADPLNKMTRGRRKVPPPAPDPVARLEKLNLSQTDLDIIEYLAEELKSKK